MVLGVVNPERDVMSPRLYLQGLMVNAAHYKVMLERVVRLWIESVSKERQYI